MGVSFELGWLTSTLHDFHRTEISIIQTLSILSLARTWITWRLGTGTRFRHLKQAASFAWHTVALQRRRHSVIGIAGSCDCRDRRSWRTTSGRSAYSRRAGVVQH